MSRLKTPFRLLLITLTAVLGAWLLRHPGLPAPEDPLRGALLRGVVAVPAGAADIPPAARPTQVAPVTVELAALASGTRLEEGAFERWVAGVADLPATERMATLPPAPAPTGTVQAAGEGDAPLVRVDRLFNGPGYLESGAMPPDPTLAVGPDHVVAAVNGALKVYDLDGTPLTLAYRLTTLFDQSGVVAGCRQHPFDPDLLYDEAGDRFLLVTAGMSGGIGDALCVAVSATPDPTGAWHLYSIATSVNGSFFDYPRAGIGVEAVYVGANNMWAPGGAGQVWALRRADLLAGRPAVVAMRSLGEGYAVPTPNPLHLTGYRQLSWPAAGPHYVLVHHHDARSYDVWSWSDPFGGDAFTLVGGFDLVAETGVPAGFPVDTPQLDGTPLAGNDSRMWDFEYRGGYAWTTMHVACDPGGGAVNCIRWAQIDPATATVVDSGLLGGGAGRMYPDLAVNQCGDMLLGFSVVGADMHPALAITGRLAGAPAGRLQQETLLAAARVPYQATGLDPLRWGDYTDMVIAPDGLSFWYIGPLSASQALPANANWSTLIARLQFPDCTAPALFHTYLPLATAGP